jgi:hypothetical protein
MGAAMHFDAEAQMFRSLLQDYETITLVANNPSLKLDRLPASEEKQLFVFLNTAVPVQSVTRFDRDCIILSGLSAKAVFSLKGDRVIGVDRIEPGRCKAVAVIRSKAYERPELKNWTGPWFDLPADGPWTYPPGKGPSTGFTALNHLLRGKPGNAQLKLLGFTGRSSTRRKLNNAHDWVYEQLYIRMLAECGKVTLDDADPNIMSEIDMLRRSFPEVSEDQFNRVMQRYAAEELRYLKMSVHGVIKILWPITVLAKRLHFG